MITKFVVAGSLILTITVGLATGQFVYAKKQSLAAVDFETVFVQLSLSKDKIEQQKSLDVIKENWQRGLVPFVIDAFLFTSSVGIQGELLELIKAEHAKDSAGKAIGDLDSIYQWWWNQETRAFDGYDNYKAKLLSLIDPKFEKYFLNRSKQSLIRLDEIRWGGVRQDGIPPLRNPELVLADQADYLEDDNIVFGIELNGETRAYPKRILAWHEMAIDTVGGVELAIVYCTLCGTVVPYRTVLVTRVRTSNWVLVGFYIGLIN